VDNNQLARKTLKEDLNTPSNDPYFQEEVLADGIDVFRIQFGIDSDADGKVDYYTSSPSSTEMTTAVVARIYVLARGESPVRGYTNTKTYQLGDLAIPAFVDGFYRKVFSTSVTMRNPIARQQFN
jgi:type IV pilus assembly protein PilW